MAPRRVDRANPGAKGSKLATALAPEDSSSDLTPKQPINHEVSSFEISSVNGKPIKCEQYSPSHGKSSPKAAATAPRLIFTHGAGGGLSNPATSCFAIGAASAITTIVFEGGFSLVARTKQYQTLLQHVLDSQLEKGENSEIPALGGRSLGARAAVQTTNARHADTSSTSPLPKTLILVSYPLTGPKGDTRDAILRELRSDVDVLFVSGDRDSMCDLQQLNDVRKHMRAHTWLAVVQGADHGMSVKPASAVEASRKATGELAARWLASRDRERTECVAIGTDIEEWAAPVEPDTKKGKGAKRKAPGKADGVKRTKKSR